MHNIKQCIKHRVYQQKSNDIFLRFKKVVLYSSSAMTNLKHKYHQHISTVLKMFEAGFYCIKNKLNNKTSLLNLLCKIFFKLLKLKKKLKLARGTLTPIFLF